MYPNVNFQTQRGSNCFKVIEMPNDTKFILGTTLARFAVSWNFPLPSLIWPEGMRSSYGGGASVHVKAIQVTY